MRRIGKNRNIVIAAVGILILMTAAFLCGCSGNDGNISASYEQGNNKDSSASYQQGNNEDFSASYQQGNNKDSSASYDQGKNEVSTLPYDLEKGNNSTLTVFDTPVSSQDLFFDTICSISVYAMEEGSEETARQIIREAFEECRRYENLLSRTREGTEIWKINHADGREVVCSKETLEVIQSGIKFGDITGGKFDITIGPAEDLWNFHASEENGGDTENTGTLPDGEMLRLAMEHVDYRNVVIHEDTGAVSMKDPEAELDLGGIAKGFIADQLCYFLNSNRVTSAIVNLGGNIACIGAKPVSGNGAQNKPFRIGIETPYSDRTSIIGSVEVVSGTAVTSGIYERFITVDGVQYHHILDAATGYPAVTDVVGVTITGPLGKSMECDAMATACLLMGTEEGMALIESMDGFEALFIDDQNEYHLSSGMEFTKTE